MENNNLFELLFKRKATDEGTREYLLQLTREHPYFSPAQFFLLQQTPENAPGYLRQASITAAIFNNPYWLNFQLENPKYNGIEVEETVLEKEIAPIILHMKFPAEINSSDTESRLFEPMHLVDYFASQGIKLSEEQQASDKLGKQLKSFTEWLKTMKKVHLGNAGVAESPGLDEKGSEITDQNIQTLAEKSNTGAEVLTESMAEVLARQGMKEKAIEIYRKLSLLDHAKIAYFAAKIETLKGT